jgi:hypothetical protein
VVFGFVARARRLLDRRSRVRDGSMTTTVFDGDGVSRTRIRIHDDDDDDATTTMTTR